MASTITRNPETEATQQSPQQKAVKPPFWAVLLRNAVWSVLSVVACILVLEGIFAVAHVGEETFIQLEPRYGNGHMPGKMLTWRQEGYSHLTFNSDGFRDVERAVAKPPGTKRIVILGNSMVEGCQVLDDKTACQMLERRLNQEFGNHYEVLNGAVAGFSQMQDLYLFKDKLLKYKPDVCILSYHYGDNEKNIATDYVKYELPRPYGSLDEQNRLRTDWSAFDGCWKSANAAFFKSTQWLRRNSRLWDVLLQTDMQLAGFKPYNQARAGAFKLASAAGISASADGEQAATKGQRMSVTSEDMVGDANPDSSYYADLDTVVPPAPIMKDFPMPTTYSKKKAEEVAAIRYESASWRAIQAACRKRFWTTVRVFEEFNLLCEKNNCKLVVLGLPARNNNILYFKELQFLHNLARAHNFTVIDSNGIFPKLGPAERSDYYYDLHFTPKGHDAIARALYDGLTRDKLVP